MLSHYPNRSVSRLGCRFLFALTFLTPLLSTAGFILLDAGPTPPFIGVETLLLASSLYAAACVSYHSEKLELSHARRSSMSVFDKPPNRQEFTALPGRPRITGSTWSSVAHRILLATNQRRIEFASDASTWERALLVCWLEAYRPGSNRPERNQRLLQPDSSAVENRAWPA